MRTTIALALFSLAACGDPASPRDAAVPDGGPDAGSVTQCERATDCNTSAPCTMAVCEPGNPSADARGCIVSSSCTEGEVCRDGTCVPYCEVPDADGDGDPAEDCGGNDCDDDNPAVRSGRQEVCDAAGVNEDCNPETFNSRAAGAEDGDRDRDGFVDFACLNVADDGTVFRGSDCDDTVPGVANDTRTSCGSCGNECQFACGSSSCDDAVQLTLGVNHSCARLSSGRILCWGQGELGQLGNGFSVSSSTPVAVLGIDNAVDVAAGSDHTCAVLATGSVMCWGRNNFGQLGDGSTDNQASPRRVAIGIGTAVRVASGGQHSCALLGDGRVTCWGDVPSYFMTIGTSGITSAMAISSHAGALQTCVTRDSGLVACWGSNWAGQLGRGFTSTGESPADVPALATVESIAVGALHSCALTTAGEVHCWGRNDLGQLGVGDLMDRSSPAAVVGLSGIASIAASAEGTCAVGASGTASCWGRNAEGQLGTADTSIRVTSPMPVLDLVNVLAIAGGHHHTCAIAGVPSRVVCWGDNFHGQLGDGTTEDRSMPTEVAPAE